MSEAPRILQIGNFEPPHSTENDLRYALHQLGTDTVPLQEQDVNGWRYVAPGVGFYDMVMWTSTHDYALLVPDEIQFRLLDTARRSGVPTVGVHLDRWWGLHEAGRQEKLDRPFFSCLKLFTADGGHDDMWPTIGVDHAWMPPAISERWCYPAEPKPQYVCDIVFVGGWQNYGHTEWTHRAEMIERVRGWYGERFRCLPLQGEPRITQGELNHVYASAKVVLGDSCLVPRDDGEPIERYCSDRIPETLGRGGVLVHPYVAGVTGPVFIHDSWELGDWDALHRTLECELEAPSSQEHRDGYRLANIERIKDGGTYTHRMRDVLDNVLGWRP